VQSGGRGVIAIECGQGDLQLLIEEVVFQRFDSGFVFGITH
jgi:hypothetical protein